VTTREAATPAASTPTGAASRGHSSATPAAKAAAEAECPDGNDVVTGSRRGRRWAGVSSADGRRLRTACLASTFAAKLAVSAASIPRSAARRARRSPVAASATLIIHHSRLWFARRPRTGRIRATRASVAAILPSIRRSVARSCRHILAA
jgi:hypothetical protein